MAHWWQLGLVAMLMPAVGGQDVPAPTAATPVPHGRICSGDDGATKRPTLLDGYGSGGFVISGAEPMAQKFFDNGMQLAAAFAHKAAIQAMSEAVRLDPKCAMCLWGEAWVGGPTINYPVEEAARPELAAIVARARQLATSSAPPRELALIDALALRYDRKTKPAAANLNFARAMDRLAEAYPADDAIATIAADAWLVASFDQGKAGAAQQLRSVALLERVLARSPDYTPAIHFYIHATEIAKFPARATPYADRLERLAPKASHLVHMPSHTYYWIGRYQDAADSNLRAVDLGIQNARRLGMALPDGVWDLPYHAHNVHFGLGGALMSGDQKVALVLADPLVRVAGVKDKSDVYLQAVALMGYAAQGRFADPAKVMALPEPKLPYLRAFWHYARGEALTRQSDVAGVAREAKAITAMQSEKAVADKVGNKLVRIAGLVLTGRAAMLANDPQRAVAAFKKATKIEESPSIDDYSDPPVWWYPVRRSLAEARLAAGDAKGALADADRSLKRRPQDPMTLAVRARAATALGDRAAAGRDARRALAGWRGQRSAFRPNLI